MNPAYVAERQRLMREINDRKTVYQFRTFLYSLYKNSRREVFELCRTYLENELQDQTINMTERERIQATLNHFDWETFDTRSVHWWTMLSNNHTRCRTLVELMNTWISGLTLVNNNNNIPDDGSLGLR